MAKEEKPKETEETKRQRGTFPRVELKTVLELTTAIFEEGHGDPVRRRTAFEKLNRSAESSTSYTLLQAANGGYGLVSGSKNSTHLELTDRSKIRSNPDTANDKKTDLIYELLFSNSYFAAFVEKYKDKPLPNDTIAEDYLVREQKLNPADAKSCWAVFKENLTDFNLIEESGAKKIVLDRELATSRAKSNVKPGEDAREKLKGKPNPAFDEDEPTQIDKRGSSGKPFRNSPQLTFNIQVVLPENATPEVYDAIFASMSKHLLG